MNRGVNTFVNILCGHDINMKRINQLVSGITLCSGGCNAFSRIFGK